MLLTPLFLRTKSSHSLRMCRTGTPALIAESSTTFPKSPKSARISLDSWAWKTPSATYRALGGFEHYDECESVAPGSAAAGTYLLPSPVLCLRDSLLSPLYIGGSWQGVETQFPVFPCQGWGIGECVAGGGWRGGGTRKEIRPSVI